jgi:cytidine deaminase
MMIEKTLAKKLIDAAIAVRQRAYVPYSHYAVGAAVLTPSGKIFTGVNIENAAYPSGICAERVAIFKAVSEGEHQFTACAVVTDNGGSPCGACRQVMVEFSPEMVVLIANGDGELMLESTVDGLLPHGFRPEHLSPRL